MIFRSIAVLVLLTIPTALAQQGLAKPVLPTAPAKAEKATEPKAASEPTTAVDTSTYIIGPEDSIQITVWKEAGFTGVIHVRPDGMITLALIGDMPAAGFTPMQLAADVASRLKKFIQDPNVTVSVISVHPKQVFLLGEVQHVGPVIMTPGMTPLQAISAAGGLTPFANGKRVYILRGAKGHEQKIPFDYKKAIKSGTQQGVSLNAGDTIVAP
ncbi:MAG: polysaccharide biosynthesis/export family protein [Bryocella sp.]